MQCGPGRRGACRGAGLASVWTAVGPDTGCLAMWPQKVDEWRSPSFLDS